MTDAEKILLHSWDQYIRQETAFLNSMKDNLKNVSPIAKEYINQYPAVWFKRRYEQPIVFTKILLTYAKLHQLRLDKPFVLICKTSGQLYEAGMGIVPLAHLSVADWKIKVNSLFANALSLARQGPSLSSSTATLFGSKERVAPLPAILPLLVLLDDGDVPPPLAPLAM